MAEKKGFLRRLMSAVPGTDANKEAASEEQAIRDRANASVAAYEQRTGDKFVPEEGIEEDRVTTAIMDLPLSGPMAIPNVGKTLARMAVGSGVRGAADKAKVDANTREMKQKGWIRLSGPERDKYGNNFDNFLREQVDLDKRLMQQAAAKLKEAKDFRQDPSKIKAGEVNDFYDKTKETFRPLEDVKVISTPKRLADMSSNVPPAKAAVKPDVVRDVEFPEYEGLSAQQILDAKRKMKDRGL